MPRALDLDSEGSSSLDHHWLLQQIVQSSPYTTVLCDATHPETPIIHVDEKFEAHSGYQPQDVLGKNPRFLHRDDLDQPELDVIRQALHDTVPCHVTLRNYRKDGTLFWNEMRITPLFDDDDGHLRYYLSIQRDVTAEIEAAELREAYRTLAENSANGMAIMRGDELLVINPAFSDMLGYTLEDYQLMTPKERWETVHPDDRANVRHYYHQCLLGEVNHLLGYETQMRHKNGKYVWVETSITRIMFQGRPALQVTMVDITERKGMQTQLQEREAMFRSFVEQSNDGLMLVDTNGAVIIWNAAQERMTGVSRDDALGQQLFDVPSWAAGNTDHPLNQRRNTALRDMVPRALAGEYMPWMGQPLETTLRDSDGKTHWVQSVIFPIRSSHGYMLGSVTRDISESKQMEAQLRHSERRHKLLADVTLEGLVIHQNGLVLDANQRFVEMFGYSLKDLKGRNIVQMIFADESRDLVQHHVHTQYEGIYQAMGRHRNGHTFPVELETRQIDDNTRVASLRDITERRAAEARLQASEARLRTAADNFPDGLILLLDHDLRLVMARGPLVERVGFAPDELEGQTLDALSGAHALGTVEPYMRATLAGQPQSFEFEEGTLVVNVQCVPIYDGDAVVMAMVVAQDITRRKNDQQAAFRVALEKERVKLLQSFIEAAAHEFRTPLSVIHVNAHMMTMVDDSAKRERSMTVIANHIELLTRLIEMLIAMVKLDSNAYTFEETDAARLLRQICQAQATRTTTHNIECTIDDGLPMVMANQVLLTDALAALVDNACRYSDEGSTITLHGYQEANAVVVSVRDEGVGISAEDQERIFDSFWRTDHARTTHGLGLGLPFARKVVMLHGGTLTVKSKPGQGSTFYLRVPIPNITQQ